MSKNTFKSISILISVVSLIIILYFAIVIFIHSAMLESPDFKTYLLWTNIASLMWFIFSPFWLISKKDEALK